MAKSKKDNHEKKITIRSGIDELLAIEKRVLMRVHGPEEGVKIFEQLNGDAPIPDDVDVDYEPTDEELAEMDDDAIDAELDRLYVEVCEKYPNE